MIHPTTSDTPHITLVRKAPQGLTPHTSGRLGVFGGAYNPITSAHVAIANIVRDTFALHEVLLLLPQVPPHKSIFGATLEQRLEMMHLAIAEYPALSAGLCSHGLFIDMYQGLLSLYAPQTEVFFITGRDAAERILTWHYDDTEATLQQMFAAFQLIVCDRDGPFALPDNRLIQAYAHRLHRCPLPPDVEHISATTVRQRCHAGQAIEDIVPAAVARYIAAHALYTT